MICSLNTARINPDLVKDEQGSPIKLATVNKEVTQFQELTESLRPKCIQTVCIRLWKNLGGIKFDFANPIDTLKNGIKKTILLQSSQYSKKNSGQR
jgi:hypothetical protein